MSGNHSGNGAGDGWYDPSRGGGAGGDGGGLANAGILTATQSAILNNQTGLGGAGGSAYHQNTAGGPGGNGGGIANQGSLNLAQVVVRENSTGGGGPGVSASGQGYGEPGGDGGYGGGIFSSGHLTLIDSTIVQNTTGPGGTGGSASTSPGQGGPGGSGGGLYGSGVYTLTQVAIVGNQAGMGGGLSLANVTIANNHTLSGGSGGSASVPGSQGLAGSGGGIYNQLGKEARTQDTILGLNVASGNGPDCWGILQSGGYNLLHHVAFCSLTGTATGNIRSKAPLLGQVRINPPGTTPTQALLFGSPAINAGNCSGGTVTTDQRGVPRPQGPACDIGAYEFERARGQLIWLPAGLRTSP